MKTLSTVTLLIVMSVAFVWFLPSCRVIRSFDNFERHAKKVITGPELAAWGARVLAQYPTNATIRVAELGTNFPLRLRDLAPELGPHIVVYEADGKNTPAWVMVFWGSGFLGHCGFEIGPTNFAGVRGRNRWQDGVFFWNDH